KARFGAQAQPLRELRVVAKLGMHVERQVICEQVEVIVQQHFQSTLLLSDHATVLAAPEVSVVNQHGVGTGSNRRFQQCQTGGNAGDEQTDVPPSFDLQAVWAIVA